MATGSLFILPLPSGGSDLRGCRVYPEQPTQMIPGMASFEDSERRKSRDDESTREARRRPGRGFGGGDAPRGARIAPKSTSAGGLQPVAGASPPPTAAPEAGLARQAPASVRRVRPGLASPTPEDLPGLRFGALDLPDVRPGLAGGQDPEVSVSGRGAAAAGEVVRRRLGVGAARPGRGRRRPGAGAGDGRAPSTTGRGADAPETGKRGARMACTAISGSGSMFRPETGRSALRAVQGV